MQKTFQGVNVNLQLLAQNLYQWFISKGYQAQFYGAGNYYIVQAKKTGLLRHLFAADRAFTVKLFGGQGYLEVNTGLANWVKAEDVTESVLGDLILGPVGLAVEGLESLWNIEIERQIMSEVERLINSGMVSGPYPGQYGYPGGQSNFPGAQPTYPGYQPQGYPQGPQGYPQYKYCRSCGSQNPPNARFCSNCGTQL
jgi:hypothetical protein